MRDNPLELQVAESLATAERLASLDAVQSIEKWGVGVLSGDFRGRSDSPISDRKLTWTKLDWSVVASIVSRSFDGLAATIRQPDELVRLRETKAAEQELVPPPKSAVEMLGLAFSGPQARGEVVGQTLASQLMPATSQVVAAEIRARTRREMLDLALAIAEYRLDTGRLPETLDALVPAQIAAVPPDRFTQQALIYRVFEDGFELISVGQDGRFDDDPLPNSTQDICFIVRPIQILNPAIPVEAPVQ